MPQSEQIGDLAAALAKAQGMMPPALKDAQNPHLRVRYADLASVWEACRGPLSANGLAVSQLPVSTGEDVDLVTLLLHASGQWVSSSLRLTYSDQEKGRSTMQSLGSAITYARRFALMAIAGVACEDDDGHAAGTPQHVAQRAHNGHAAKPERMPPAADPKLAGPPDDAEPAREPWASFLARVVRTACDQWDSECRIELGPEAGKGKDLLNQHQVINELITRAIDAGLFDRAAVGKDGNPDMRDTTKAKAAAFNLYNTRPKSTRRTVEAYIEEKLTEARRKLFGGEVVEAEEGSQEPAAATAEREAGEEG